jgi:PAS domain S-box-containing protein
METTMHHKAANKIKVHFWDQMVLIGIGLALFYTVFDSVLYIFLSYDVDFFQRLFGPDISEIWTRITIVCLFVIFGAHAQFTINKRILAESALRESEEKFRSIVESAPDGYCEVDLDGNISFFNDSICTILGYSRPELAAMNHGQILDQTNLQKLADTFEKVIKSRNPIKSVSLTMIGKDGSKHHVESSISLLNDPKGNPTGFGGFIRDVTQRYRAETLYRAKTAAEAASRTKSEFLASMSHEIRTPLNSIIGLVDLMLSSKLPPKQREDLDVVRSSAYSLLSIINNVLDFSKIEAGKLELERSPFSLERFMDDSLKIMGMKSHEKGLELVYRISPGVPDRLLGDPTRLRQVLLNLVDNAIKFTDRGEVVILVETQTVTEYDVVLDFAVVDTGIGIPKEKQRGIFGAYNQVSPDTVRRFGGTGLGLAVTAQLVDLMDGRIKVKSQPGKGSRFRFTARFIRQQNGGSRGQQQLRDSTLSKLKILIADDNASNRNILREILEDLRVHAVLAADAHEAKDALTKAKTDSKPFDLILIDSDMPVIDGFETARWMIAENVPGAAIIVMLTFPHLKRKAELESLGIDTGLVKPLGASELQGAILKKLGVDSTGSDPTSTRLPRHDRKAKRSLNILVAEDTPFNQKFILRLLERWKHRVKLVENGRQALETMRQETYDIVLMDIQMPEMDGLTATKKFRQWESEIRKAEGGRRYEVGEDTNLKSDIDTAELVAGRNQISKIDRLPIIALTAHAVKGDLERCLAAGMDDYISKPIDSAKLFEAIERLTHEPEAGKKKPEDSQAVDRELLLKAFDGDLDFMEEVVEVFLSDYPRLIDDLRRASRDLDGDRLMRSAHSLKGVLKNFRADAAAGIAYEIEKKGKDSDFEGIQTMIAALQDQVAGLDKNLRNIIRRRPD